MREPDPERHIETPRLLLEPLKVEHASVLFTDWQAPEMYRFIPQEPPLSIEELERRYRVLATRRSPDGKEVWLNWVLRRREDWVPIGFVEVTVNPDATADLAYFTFPLFWRQGYAKEACSRVIELLFKEYRIRLVVATLDTRNVASFCLVESLGFRRIACIRGADHFKGQPSDEYRYELEAR